MKKIKNTLIISSYVLLVALLFSGGYVIGRTGMDGGKNNDRVIPGEETVEAVSEKAVQSPEYEVIAENGRIIIYKCIGEDKTIITSEEISETVFPKEDIDALKKGVKFERLESAQQMFENFVS